MRLYYSDQQLKINLGRAERGQARGKLYYFSHSAGGLGLWHQVGGSGGHCLGHPKPLTIGVSHGAFLGCPGHAVPASHTGESP